MNRKKFLRVLKKRSCSACDVCCVIMDVPTIGKERHVRCVHANGQGCAIYKDPQKPQVCSEWYCAWRMFPEVFPYDERPDRSGVMVWPAKDGSPVWVVDCIDREPETLKRLERIIAKIRKYGVRIERMGNAQEEA